MASSGGSGYEDSNGAVRGRAGLCGKAAGGGSVFVYHVVGGPGHVGPCEPKAAARFLKTQIGCRRRQCAVERSDSQSLSELDVIQICGGLVAAGRILEVQFGEHLCPNADRVKLQAHIHPGVGRQVAAGKVVVQINVSQSVGGGKEDHAQILPAGKPAVDPELQSIVVVTADAAVSVQVDCLPRVRFKGDRVDP